ncbi:MAG TPA: TraB/GumN family protein [Allosphingosinicella sp.]|jgi:hypothetical protein
MRIAGVKGLLASLCVSLALAPAASAAPSRSAPGQREAAAARPAIWMVEDRDTRIVLFGTTHSFERGFRWRSAALERAIAQADELVVEVAEDQAAHDAAWQRLMFLDTPVAILERVSPGRRPTLTRLIASSGMPAEHWDRLATLAAATLLGTLELRNAVPREARREHWAETEMSGAEIELIEDFRRLGRLVTGLETAAGQIEVFSAFSPDAQRDFLDSMVDAAATPLRDQGAAGDEHWARGDVRAIERDLQRMSPALREAMVTRRNRVWADWISQRMEQPGNLLFAVGVSHLAGRESVQRLLARRGLRARRLD